MNIWKIFIIILILDYTLGIVVTNRQMFREPRKYYTIFKTATSFDFLLLSFLVFLFTKNDFYLEFLPGYICCFIGDFLLAIAKRENGDMISSRFMAGMGIFSLGHVFYLMEFVKFLEYGFLFPVLFASLLCFGTIIASKTKYFHYGHKAPFCAVYGAIVGFMGGLGLNAILLSQGTTYVLLMGIGAVCFMCSDTILALKYFLVAKKNRKKKFGYSELTLYYIAMGLLSAFPLAIA